MGDPPGDACLYPETATDAIITADCIKLRPSPLIQEKRFIVHAINSYVVKSQILGITKGVAQLKVSLARFRSIGIPLPPLPEQEEIVADVERRFSVDPGAPFGHDALAFGGAGGVPGGVVGTADEGVGLEVVAVAGRDPAFEGATGGAGGADAVEEGLQLRGVSLEVGDAPAAGIALGAAEGDDDRADAIVLLAADAFVGREDVG